MSSLLFGKFQQFLNFGNKEFRRFSISHVNRISWVQVVLIVFASLFVSPDFFAFDVESEFFQLRSVELDEGRVQVFPDIFYPTIRPFGGSQPSEIGQLWGKASTKCCDSLVELSDLYVFLNSINGETMLDKKANKITENPTDNQTGNIFYNLLHDYFFIFKLGFLSGALTLGLIFIVTQRKK